MFLSKYIKVRFLALLVNLDAEKQQLVDQLLNFIKLQVVMFGLKALELLLVLDGMKKRLNILN